MDSYGGEIGGHILSHNAFIYALNNPIVNYDSEGEFAFAIPALFKGAATLIGLAVTYYVAKKATEALAANLAGALRNPYYNFSTVDSKSKDTTETKTDVNVKPIVQYVPKNDEKPCTTARFNLAKTDVVRGERLTISESQNYVALGGNAMCDDKTSAYSVAVKFPNHLPEPEIDKYQKPGNKYYYHYHLDRNSHRHIWFYGSP